MCFSPLIGLRVQHSKTLGKANLLLPQTHLILLHYPPLPMTTTALENSLHSLLLLLLLLTCHLLPSWPTVMQKHKQFAHQSANSLCSFVNDFMSVLDADISSSHGQTSTISKWQKVNKPVALLSASEKLKSFNSTIKDLLKFKEANKRQEWWEQASSTECHMKAMVALQKQEKSWLSFDHQITMIDYFELDLGTTDAYITLIHQHFVGCGWRNSWQTWSMWWMGLMTKESLLFNYQMDFCLFCTPSSHPYLIVVSGRM